MIIAGLDFRSAGNRKFPAVIKHVNSFPAVIAGTAFDYDIACSQLLDPSGSFLDLIQRFHLFHIGKIGCFDRIRRYYVSPLHQNSFDSGGCFRYHDHIHTLADHDRINNDIAQLETVYSTGHQLNQLGTAQHPRFHSIDTDTGDNRFDLFFHNVQTDRKNFVIPVFMRILGYDNGQSRHPVNIQLLECF